MIAAFLIYAFAFAVPMLLGFLNAQLALLAGGALLGAVLVMSYPLLGLSLLLLMLPLSQTPVMDMPIGGIPGLKPHIVFSMLVLASFIIHRKARALTRMQAWFMLAYVLLFIIAVGRSTTYIPNYTVLQWDEVYSAAKYFMSHLFKPILYLLPFFLIVFFVKTVDEIEILLNVVYVSLSIVSLFVLAIFVSMLGANYNDVRAVYEMYIGIHGNAIVLSYSVVLPVVIAHYFHSGKLRYLAYAGIYLATVILLFSRGGYLVVGVVVIVLLLLLKKYKLITMMFCLSPLVYGILPATVRARFSYGLDAGDTNSISAGRTDLIWAPLVRELLTDTKSLLVGHGRYGIFDTLTYNIYFKDKYGYAHNMYLDMVLDAGLVGLLLCLLLFASFFLFFWRRAIRHRGQEKAILLFGFAMSVAAFMFSGLTDHTMFPQVYNSIVWTMIGFGFAYVKLGGMLHDAR